MLFWAIFASPEVFEKLPVSAVCQQHVFFVRILFALVYWLLARGTAGNLWCVLKKSLARSACITKLCGAFPLGSANHVSVVFEPCEIFFAR